MDQILIWWKILSKLSKKHAYLFIVNFLQSYVLPNNLLEKRAFFQSLSSQSGVR